MLVLVMSIILTALATEATIKVLLSGKVFDAPRNFVYSKIKEGTFYGTLIRCPYCLSFWFSMLLLILMIHAPLTWFIYCAWLSIQRLSNVFDDIIDKIYYGQYGSAGLNFDNDKKEK